jgi:hypothetical protein
MSREDKRERERLRERERGRRVDVGQVRCGRGN